MKATITLTKKSALHQGIVKGQKAAGSAFTIVDNQDDTCTVTGVDAAGFPVDISGVATLAATSSDPAILTVDAPTNMDFAFHAVAPGQATITVVATWNDGSIGPFTFDLPCDVTTGAAVGLKVTPGTPVSR